MGRWAVVICGLLVASALLAGCGGSGGKTSTTSSVATTASATSGPEPAITHRLLTASELPPGFSAQGKPSLTSTIAQWLQGIQTPSDQLQSETGRLKRIGFVAAATLPLNSAQNGGQGAGVSLVEQFRSPAGPRSELADTLATVDGGPAGQVRFSVPGIPHSAGFGAPAATTA